jgi:uncharacterized membrane protein
MSTPEQPGPSTDAAESTGAGSGSQSGGGGLNIGPGTGTGLPTNVSAALSYVLGALTGILFYVIEKDQFVRFHAMQSIFFTGAWVIAWIILSVLGAILAAIPILGWLLGLILTLVLGLGGFIMWIYLMLTAFQGKTYRLPYIAPMVDKYAVAA